MICRSSQSLLHRHLKLLWCTLSSQDRLTALQNASQDALQKSARSRSRSFGVDPQAEVCSLAESVVRSAHKWHHWLPQTVCCSAPIECGRAHRGQFTTAACAPAQTYANQLRCRATIWANVWPQNSFAWATRHSDRWVASPLSRASQMRRRVENHAEPAPVPLGWAVPAPREPSKGRQVSVQSDSWRCSSVALHGCTLLPCMPALHVATAVAWQISCLWTQDVFGWRNGWSNCTHRDSAAGSHQAAVPSAGVHSLLDLGADVKDQNSSF